jgi:DNA recombination protein RmuC
MMKNDKKYFDIANNINQTNYEISNIKEILNLVQTNISQSFSNNIQSIILTQQNSADVTHKQMTQIENKFEILRTGLENKFHNIEEKFEILRNTLENKFDTFQSKSEIELNKIRNIVEEKLHETLEKRLGDSFKIVSERLEMVYQGLGEMKSLANGVGDLKKVLNNVKTRGILGEIQLGNILEQFLTTQQYSENVQIKDGSQDRIEFTVNLPGKDKEKLMLPIDAKFPLASYQRLIAAQDEGEKDKVDTELKILEQEIKKCAKTIADKYIYPPYTTDFAIMFIPIEGLYCEILRIPGLVEAIQNTYKVIITGPTTLSAIINSLQMGFRTLLIEKRSSEVWKVLDIIKKEFIKFADLLNKTRLKLEQAGGVIIDAEKRSLLLKTKLENFENKYNTQPLTVKPKLEE